VMTRWPRLRILWWINRLAFKILTMPKNKVTGAIGKKP
jgi:hypothetical protein